MPYKSKEIKHLVRQEQARGYKKPLQDLEDIEKRRKLERDVLYLLQIVRNRNDFIRELKKVTARYGQQVGSEQFEAALRAFDEYWSQRRKPLR